MVRTKIALDPLSTSTGSLKNLEQKKELPTTLSVTPVRITDTLLQRITDS